MPFNPAVADRSADYIFEGLQQAQKFAEANRLQEQRAMQQSVAQAMEAVGSAAEQWRADAKKTAAVDGRVAGIESMVRTDPRNADLFGGADVVHKLLSEKNTDKRAGMLAVALQSYDQMTANRNRLALQHDAQAFDRENNKTGQTFVVEDPVTKQKTSYLWTNKNQVAPIAGGGLPSEPQPQYDSNGKLIGHVLTVGNKARFVAAGKGGSGFMDQLGANPDEERAQLEGTIAAARKEIAGNNQKPGPDWLGDGWWFGAKPYAQQVAEAEAKLGTLPVKTGGAADGGGPAAGTAGGYKVGGIYGGKQFLGGDPKNPASWK